MQPIAVLLSMTLGACSPPPQLNATDEDLVRRCLELEHKQETSPDCTITKPMRQAFLEKHPDFYDQLLNDRKQFVENQIAEDMRKRDELNACLDAHEDGSANAPSCEKFMAHEITRGLEDRRRRSCAAATLDGKADAGSRCEGLSKADVEEEVQMERGRRERRR